MKSIIIQNKTGIANDTTLIDANTGETIKGVSACTITILPNKPITADITLLFASLDITADTATKCKIIDDACRALVGKNWDWDAECILDTDESYDAPCENDKCLCHMDENTYGANDVRDGWRRDMERALKAIKVIP